MDQILSKIDNKPLLSLLRYKDITEERVDLSAENETLQCAIKKLNKGQKFKHHKHNLIKRKTNTTQESWVFLNGRVRCYFYDIDDTLILDTILNHGDCVIVFRAGHGFDVIDENVIVYEFKNGPYYGVEADKKFLKLKK
jgi:hypothetical protein